VLASALELDARSGNEVADDAGDEYFAGSCSRCDARANADRN